MKTSRIEMNVGRLAIRRCFVATCVALAVVAPPFAHLAAAEGRGGPPQPVSFTDVFPASLTGCGFDIGISGKGKEGFVDLPGGRFIVTSPALSLTATNLSDPTHSVRLSITGALHFTEQGQNLLLTLTGRNLFFTPEVGLVLLIGQFSLVIDSDGNTVQPLSGNGQIISFCDLLR